MTPEENIPKEAKSIPDGAEGAWPDAKRSASSPIELNVSR